MVPIIKGSILITDDINFVYSIPDARFKILSLDEEGKLNPQLPNVIQATCLLPPLECLIAESDGNADVYELAYYNHLNQPFQQQFIGAIISYLYQGGSFIVYAPQLKDTISIMQLRKNLMILYGIGMGIVDSPVKFELDYRCVPIWLNMMYEARTISAKEFLFNYPKDALISPNIMQSLIIDMRLFFTNYQEAFELVNECRGEKYTIPLHQL